ncbi:hypothetical protein DFJ58DRAFT_812407 [Suillus subalutaceus]|uniref:uncharacterized protein n=1 Tax=Suillus subalutaceus TaxID=48586 RepID=UPI001B861EDA|nr:uncharacterized protein DFJ58DRAFT_812407 [Suillus subalutaceus]KAG1839412.1 hypothetical protein DFJ58DRAFT_812407 [Suillus subalutaceus]
MLSMLVSVSPSLPLRAMLNPWLIAVIGCAAQDGPTRELRSRDNDRGNRASRSQTTRCRLRSPWKMPVNIWRFQALKADRCRNVRTADSLGHADCIVQAEDVHATMEDRMLTSSPEDVILSACFHM